MNFYIKNEFICYNQSVFKSTKLHYCLLYRAAERGSRRGTVPWSLKVEGTSQPSESQVKGLLKSLGAPASLKSFLV